jgi:hypothetical protein
LSLVFEFWPVSSILAMMYHSITDNKVICSGGRSRSPERRGFWRSYGV